MLALLCATQGQAADAEPAAPAASGYVVEVPPRGKVSVVLPVYCLDPEKDAPGNGVEMACLPDLPQDDVRRVLRVKEVLLSEDEGFDELLETLLQGFRRVYAGEDAYYRLVDRGTQWALWRLNEAGFARVVASRLTVLGRYAALLRAIAASISGQTTDEVAFERHIADTAQIKDETLRANARKLLGDIRELRDSGRLFAVQDAVLKRIEGLARELENNAEENRYYFWMSGIIHSAAVMMEEHEKPDAE